MGLFDGILGGVVGSAMALAVRNYIQQQGGLTVVVQKFERQGLGGVVQSWIGTGANQPVSAAQLEQVLGRDLVDELVAKTGVPAPELLEKLAQVLPRTVDEMTPGGVIPQA